MTAEPRCQVVIATRDRRSDLLRTLQRLSELPEEPGIVVVDNGSSDDTTRAVRDGFARVDLVEAGANLGAAGRNIGVSRATAPVVAFSDDDSWWEPGSLRASVELFDRYPRLGLIAGRIRLADGRDDPICSDMATSPLPVRMSLPGAPVLGFAACAAIVRRSAFLSAGGFHPRFCIGGEEHLFALDLASAGWGLAYVPQLVAQHRPSPARDTGRRRALTVRNALWATWLRRSPAVAARLSARILAEARWDRAARRGVMDAAIGSGWILRERRPVPAAIEQDLSLLGR